MNEAEVKTIVHNTIKEIFSKEPIRYSFTDDEYGEAAKKLSQDMPNYLTHSYPGDAGIDLPIVLNEQDRNHTRKLIWPDERVMLHTGIIMEFPIGFWGRIIHRSSTEKQHRLRVIEGVIDDYRGEILIQVHNGNACQVEVYHGDRLAQLILAKTASFKCEYSNTLRPSKRSTSGFGSSGR